jgi:endonuclease-3 related protein
MACREDLLKIYDLLNGYFGDLQWWPADDFFEVMVGAILTQNTAWTNVEKAILRLRERDLLSPAAIAGVDEEILAEAIRPSGYYRLKAARLKSYVRFFLDEYSGNPAEMRSAPLEPLRKKLLAVWGIGPETADSILLYACDRPSFVSDAYTERILHRHGMIQEKADYHHIRELFMAHLPQEAPLFKQYHALLVNTGKKFCRKTAQCSLCPLSIMRAETVMA